MFWKTAVVSILRDPTIERALVREFNRHSPGKDCSIVLEALKNYFSNANPGFEHNWFTFDDQCTVTISREGVYFSVPSNVTQETKENCEYSQWIICEKITQNTWLRTFLGRYPAIEDDMPE